MQIAAKSQDVIEDRTRAYTGWLVSNQQFRREVAALREAVGATVQQARGFPRYPRWPDFDGTLGNVDAEPTFYKTCFAFYCRWGLDRMLTWDWPLPMQPALSSGILRDDSNFAEAGITLMIPWYLIRGEKLDIGSIIEQARNACRASHLVDWVRHRKGDTGDIGYAQLSEIYRYRELALDRRYENCQGNVAAVDRAIARILHRDEDTVKKLRLKLARLRG
jgi:hypothetical protein